MTQTALDRAEERLMALELSQKAERLVPAEPRASSRPALKVVKLEPEAAAATVAPVEPEAAGAGTASTPAAPADSDADGERPLIQGEGDDLQSSLDPPRAKKSKTGHARTARPPRAE